MPQKKRSQEIFGIHRALAFNPEVKKFAMRWPGVIQGTRELAIVFKAVTQKFFFADLSSRKKDVVSFGRIYAREPDAVLDLMKIVRKILAKWQSSEAGIVKVFLLTHQTVSIDQRRQEFDKNGDCVAIIVKSKLDDSQECIRVSSLPHDKINELTYSKLAAVSSLLDKEIATLLNVKPESVKKARQSIARQDEQIAFWENPEVVRYMQTGVITPKLKRIWKMRLNGKN
jgi:hypothetical protein